MTHALEPNPGDRPSHLVLARYATGELQGTERDEVEAWLTAHPEGRAYLDELEAARAEVRPLDTAALRRRAAQIADEAPAVPAPANRPAFSLRWAVPLLVAALAAIFVLVGGPQDLHPYDPGIRVKGEAALLVHELGADDKLHLYAGGPKGEGDALGFRVVGAGHASVVVLSVDGTGAVTVFYPERGAGAEPLPDRTEDVALPGTVVLDGAPGPEVFVAVFDVTAEQAVDEVRRTFQSGGHEAVVAWARDAADADAVVVERR